QQNGAPPVGDPHRLTSAAWALEHGIAKMSICGSLHSMRPPPTISGTTQPGPSSVADRGGTCREASVHPIWGHRALTPVYSRPQAERPQITIASAPCHVSRPISLHLTF